MLTVSFSKELTSSIHHIGNEATPLFVFEQFVDKPQQLRQLAANEAQDFIAQPSDYYPGIRRNAPQAYHALLGKQLLPLLKQYPPFSRATQIDVTLSAFSIATTKPAQLKPIQMLPHFDTPADNQFALVHYLCEHRHGGTSFYRHKASGFERINAERDHSYRLTLKQQAMAAKLHQRPGYIRGSTSLFEQFYTVSAQMNRAILYPSNVLHSGDIQPHIGLSAAPDAGRLTISSFITVK
ncbi:hypothetical protein tinsulaeT_23970 [Thalassotalea insulae]|uniref:Uncharacterized protein n=1 Tax=Thalassotalea insulae TaxID=2056778 RepID=A0ABQ6GUN3_9GAMM|nr:DUF6445 family protein [Thalassotalea insulae]GLX79057.1 hypothetical protein tinsulaeT_23970 [Thalassotalea insulae]